MAYTTVVVADACPDSAWRSLPLVNDPVDAVYFSNVTDWERKDIELYVSEEIVPRSAVSLAFLAISIFLLLYFLIWRILRCCCITICCSNSCEADKQSENQEAIIKGKGTTISQYIIFGTIFLSSGFVIFGLVTLDKDLVANGWITLTSAQTFASGVSRSLSNLDAPLVAVAAAATCLRTELPSQAVVVENANNIIAAADSASSVISSSIKSIDDDLISEIDKIDADYYDTSSKAGDLWPQVTIACLCAFALMSLILSLFVFLMCPFGIFLGVLLVLLLGILYFVITALIGMGMVVLGDTCPQMEEITLILTEDEPSAVILLRYYLSPSPAAGTTLETVLKDGDVVDIQDIRQEVVDISNGMESLVPPAMMTPAVQECLDSLTLAASQVTTGIDGLLVALSHTAVHGIYKTTKAYLCCDVPGVTLNIWIAFTGLGWMCLLVCIGAMVLMSRLDKLPQSGCCCSCSCIKSSGNQVAPESDPYGNPYAKPNGNPNDNPNGNLNGSPYENPNGSPGGRPDSKGGGNGPPRDPSKPDTAPREQEMRSKPAGGWMEGAEI